MKKNIIFIFTMIVVLLVLFAISRKKFPAIPGDAGHLGITDTEICMGCHGPEEDNQMKESHPPKFKCFKCHKKQRQGSRSQGFKDSSEKQKKR